MKYTFRERTVQQAMREVMNCLGDSAIVLQTTEIRVPHRETPVGYEVVATGTPIREIKQASPIPGVTVAQTKQREKKTPDTLIQPRMNPMQVDECTEEVMIQLCDVINELRGLKEASQRCLETRALLEQAQHEITHVAKQWDAIEESHANAISYAPLWSRPERIVAALIGPSGAGKTTAAFQLASQARTLGIPVGLISLDTERAGKHESLIQDGKNLEIPVRPASTKQDLMRAIFEFSDMDLVLIDTPGHSPWNREVVSDLIGLFEGPGIERHLVLPGTWNEEELLDAVDQYGASIDAILGTRIEEEDAIERLFCLARWTEIPLCHGSSNSHIVDGKTLMKDKEARQDLPSLGNPFLPGPGEPTWSL